MASKAVMKSTLFLCVSLLSISAITTAHNITKILESNPDYSEFNNFLSQTKLADEINSRQTITVLVFNNAAMSSLTSKHPLSVVKNILSLHVLLDFFDPKKLHQISNGTTLTTTLYQTTGNAPGQEGSVNVTDLKGGAVGFGSAVPGSKLDSQYVKSVKQEGYNISVIEITAPIITPALLTAPAPSASDVNITALLDKAGCKQFASLIVSSGVLKFYQGQMDKGLTIFAPNDEAFKAKSVPDISKLSNAEQVSLLQYHALHSYTPKGSLKASKDPLPTLATNGAGKYDISVTTAGDDITLHTGVGSARVASTVLDATPVVIYSIDGILLPEELFGKSPTPAPAPAPEAKSPSPAPGTAPSPAKAPSPVASPTAPPMETPEGAPAGGPASGPAGGPADASAEDSTSGVYQSGISVLMKVVSILSAVIAVAIVS